MNEYRLNRSNMQSMSKKVFNELMQWNMNKDLLLWPLRGQHYIEHCKVLVPFASEMFTEFLDFKTRIFMDDCKFGLFLDDSPDLDAYNLFIAVQYLDNIKSNDEFILIKEGNLLKYIPEKQKKALIFECHTSATSNGGLIYEFMKSMEYHMENQNKLYLIK